MSKPLVRSLYANIDAPARAAVERAVSLTEERGLDLYLVGGAVRDLLLGSAHFDIDLVVEGDAIGLAGELSRRLHGRVTSHPRFGTATVKGAGYRIDLARARSERYSRPGALPTVEPAPLADDLARRDFTINAMALRLTGRDAGRLIDPHGGQRDLRAGVVRVLHDRSFRDDATRILRAIRYAGRLRLRLERGTERLLRRDLSYLTAISGARLRHELERIALEERAAAIVSLGADLGAWRDIIPSLCVSDRTLSALENMPLDAPAERRQAIFVCSLLSGVSANQIETVISRLSLTGRQASAVRGLAALRESREALTRKALRPSQAVALLSGQPPEAIEALALLTDHPIVSDRLHRYLDEWRFVRSRLNGRDIEALGVPHGPQVGAALYALLAARLDGAVATRDDEVAFVEKFRSSRAPARARGG